MHIQLDISDDFLKAIEAMSSVCKLYNLQESDYQFHLITNGGDLAKPIANVWILISEEAKARLEAKGQLHKILNDIDKART